MDKKFYTDLIFSKKKSDNADSICDSPFSYLLI